MCSSSGNDTHKVDTENIDNIIAFWHHITPFFTIVRTWVMFTIRCVFVISFASRSPIILSAFSTADTSGSNYQCSVCSKHAFWNSCLISGQGSPWLCNHSFLSSSAKVFFICSGLTAVYPLSVQMVKEKDSDASYLWMSALYGSCFYDIYKIINYPCFQVP